MYRKNLIGQKFGTRTVIEECEERKNGYVMYKVRCDCGEEIKLGTSYIKKNRPCKCCSAKKNTKKGSEHPAYKHGMATRTKGKDRIYSIWVAMRQRCNDPNDRNYKNYGGRGIKVSEEWNDFKKFYEDMGERPENTSIERIDNNGNYCKENCIWANWKIQQNNKRTTTKFDVKGNIVTRTQIQEKLKWTRDQYRKRAEKKGVQWILDRYQEEIEIDGM